MLHKTTTAHCMCIPQATHVHVWLGLEPYTLTIGAATPPRLLLRLQLNEFGPLNARYPRNMQIGEITNKEKEE